MNDVTINVARDFSRYPSGRYRADSKASGERFRDDFILPVLKDGGRVIIQLDGTLGYGSSFLDEAFGGLRRVHNLAPDHLFASICLETENAILRTEIESYLH